jgi:HEAT repeat protein
LRESAASWLGRELSGDGSPTLITGLVALARDPDAPMDVRSKAAGALAHAGPGATTQLVALASGDDPAVAKAALSALGRSDDPRAREAVRRAAQNESLSEPARVQAIRSLGDRDATPADVAALRGLWPKLDGDQTRNAVLDVLASIGGSANAEWALGVAADEREPSAQRARAVRAAERAGAAPSALIALYDRAADRRVKDAVLDALARIGDRASTAKIEGVAREDTDPRLRRSALGRLAKLGSDEARAALEAVIDRP